MRCQIFSGVSKLLQELHNAHAWGCNPKTGKMKRSKAVFGLEETRHPFWEDTVGAGREEEGGAEQRRAGRCSRTGLH